MAIDACHVIYTIRITRLFFLIKSRLAASNTLEEKFSHIVLYLHLVSLHSHSLPHLSLFYVLFCSFLQSAINLCYIHIQGLSISPNILSVQHSISLPTVGNIHISTYFPRYDIIRQMTNSLLSPFVFPAFPSLLLFFSGVTTGQEGKYFSVSYSLIASHSNSIHTLYFNPSPHICLILLWLCMAMDFGACHGIWTPVCVYQPK